MSPLLATGFQGGNISALKHVFTAQKRAVRTLFGIPKVNKHCKGHIQ